MFLGHLAAQELFQLALPAADGAVDQDAALVALDFEKDVLGDFHFLGLRLRRVLAVFLGCGVLAAGQAGQAEDAEPGQQAIALRVGVHAVHHSRPSGGSEGKTAGGEQR